MLPANKAQVLTALVLFWRAAQKVATFLGFSKMLFFFSLGALILMNPSTTQACILSSYVRIVQEAGAVAVIVNISDFDLFEPRYSSFFQIPVVLAINTTFNLLASEQSNNSNFRLSLLGADSSVFPGYRRHISVLESFRVWVGVAQGVLIIIIVCLLCDTFFKRLKRVLVRTNYSLDAVLVFLFLASSFRFFSVVVDPFSSSATLTPYGRRMLEELSINSLLSVYILIAALWFEVWRNNKHISELRKKVLIPTVCLITVCYLNAILLSTVSYVISSESALLVYFVLLAFIAWAVLLTFIILAFYILLKLGFSAKDVTKNKKLIRVKKTQKKRLKKSFLPLF
jgi:hypothetical protein